MLVKFWKNCEEFSKRLLLTNYNNAPVTHIQLLNAHYMLNHVCKNLFHQWLVIEGSYQVVIVRFSKWPLKCFLNHFYFHPVSSYIHFCRTFEDCSSAIWDKGKEFICIDRCINEEQSAVSPVFQKKPFFVCIKQCL